MSAGDELTIHEMKAGEVDELLRMIVDVFEDVSVAKNTVDRFGPLNGFGWEVAKADSAHRDIDSADIVLVGEVGGAVAAMATIKYDRKFSIGHIGHMAVAREYQGRGFGRRMMRAAIDRMRADGIKYSSIDALEQNPRAEKLYKSEGYTEVARKIMMFRPL